MTPHEIARRANGYAEHLLREGPGVVTGELAGPRPGERLRAMRDDDAGVPVLRLFVGDVN